MASCAKDTAPASTGPAVLRLPRKAKSVIFLHMEGGPSQVDTFDPKPRLAAENGQPLKIDAPLRMKKERVFQSPFKFTQHGQSGIPISELFPHLSRVVDHLCVIRSMVSEHADHGTASYFLCTGHALRGRPSMGSWFSYGLGSANENLPAYIVMHDGEQLAGGPEMLGNGFLPAKHAHTQLGEGPEPLQNLRRREPTAALQQRKLAAIRELNRGDIDLKGGNSQLESMIENYELAFRMQSSVLESVDLAGESEATKKLYGIDDPHTQIYGTRCLRARRLVERGVRFIQLVSPDLTNFAADMIRWDQHTELVAGHRLNASLIDKPVAGLLTDLHNRGLLDETLVLWGGEFGRTPTAQSNFTQFKIGRDHNPWGFSMWMAGGGIKGGTIHGATDEYGFRSVENIVTMHDLHATILHLCGIDHTALTYRFGGRDVRLTDVYGDVIKDILA
ncbi:DUF1501 domain-containing protein [bacterium]|nr:DUF1501 domain-containing protein [bacterium]